MTPWAAMEEERLAFLYELYKRSEGNPRQGVPYEDLIDALRFGERVMKRFQHELQEAGLVELTAVPPLTRVGRTVMDAAHRPRARQTIGITPQGVQRVEAFWATLNPGPPLPTMDRGHATAPPDRSP